MDSREQQLDRREREISGEERRIENSKIPGDDIFLVGDDIEAATYRANGGDCYWARLAGTSGEFNDIITNGDGPAIVTISSSDVAFESRFCGEWTPIE